jgi:hypothetical protein
MPPIDAFVALKLPPEGAVDPDGEKVMLTV